MKLLLVAVVLMFLVPVQWEPNFENAKITAKEKHELILLNFSGSDWCGPCIMLRKNYLENEAFTNFSKDKLVLVNADFPRKKQNKGTPEVIKRNDALAEKYNKNGIFPLTLILNSDGKVLKSFEGKPDVSVEKWIEQIQTVCAANK